jgi:hypothetical protein
LIPRLSRFYPQCPHPSGNWLKVELRLFRAYVAALPKLRAEETLAAIQVGHAYVERPMQQHARGQYVKGLEKAQSGEGPRRLDKGDLGRIASMLPVRKVGAAAEGDDA